VQTVKDVVALIKFQAKEKKLDFQFKNSINFALLINSDSNRLRQILFNLLGNALKFTVKGHIHVILEIHKKFGKYCVYLAVEDTGIGIKSEGLENLFKLYGKLEQTDQKYQQAGNWAWTLHFQHYCQL
jgi:signal transduction histidine kinase